MTCAPNHKLEDAKRAGWKDIVIFEAVMAAFLGLNMLVYLHVEKCAEKNEN